MKTHTLKFRALTLLAALTLDLKQSWRSIAHRAWARQLAVGAAIVFVLTASQVLQAQTYKVIYNFTGGQDGGSPLAGLTMDKAGNLYGTAYGWGTHGFGTVYQLKLKNGNGTLNPLYSFAGGSDGTNPAARVIFGRDGALYGTTFLGGGGAGEGTVFKVRPSPSACKTALCPWTETHLYSFTFVGGSGPLGDLLFDQAGNIYGTTIAGGENDNGIVYELTPTGNSWTESVLHYFDGTDGAGPQTGLIFDSSGNLYSTTQSGGANGYGTAFQMTYSAGTGWTESLLYSFGYGSDGGYPYTGLIFDRSGNLYSATSDGGAGGGGVVFELTSGAGGTWTFTPLYSFTGTAGNKCGPDDLSMDSAGDLYGATFCDGAYGYGNVFELIQSNGGWTYKDLYDFTGGTDGANPVSNVLIHSNGKLYGTASIGGSSGNCSGGCGVVWEITP
jgi:uncharacterized repeat protein (TIGR03803 family)